MMKASSSLTVTTSAGISDLDPGALADVFVIGRLIRVLKPPPAADIVDQDGVELGGAGFDIGDQLLERGAAPDREPALAVIGVGLDDFDPTLLGVVLDDLGLVPGGILLVLGRHAHVLRRPKLRLLPSAAVQLSLRCPKLRQGTFAWVAGSIKSRVGIPAGYQCAKGVASPGLHQIITSVRQTLLECARI
jgi:hypothetical protein